MSEWFEDYSNMGERFDDETVFEIIIGAPCSEPPERSNEDSQFVKDLIKAVSEPLIEEDLKPQYSMGHNWHTSSHGWFFIPEEISS